MSAPSSSGYRSLMTAAAVLAALGWPGLLLVMSTTLPTLGPRWLFFLLWTAAVIGSSLPFLWLINRRFATTPAPPPVLLRQAIWVGLFAGLCAWLQVNRTLSLALALLLAAGLAGLEALVRLLERSAWRPGR
jgi:hypothetical protein